MMLRLDADCGVEMAKLKSCLEFPWWGNKRPLCPIVHGITPWCPTQEFVTFAL